MTPPPLPRIRAHGTHREVGERLGLACAATIRSEVAFDADIPEGRSRTEQLALAERYRDVTYEAYPWYRDEMEGMAEAAEVDPLALFASMVEEIWYVPYARRVQGRCTDLVAVPPATSGDHVLVAHNNDLRRAEEERLVAVELRVDGDPAVFGIGSGTWLSCGWNDAGVSMTGNELAPLDERVGIPRAVQFRAMLRQPTLERAVGEALRHDRASSYNQVLVAKDGEVVNVEGSATDAELTGVDERGHLAHTNHYVCDRMRRYEGDPAYRVRSTRRLARAAELLGSAEPGSIDVAMLRSFLSDHEGHPDSLCRHPEWVDGTVSATVFWWIADLTEMVLTYGRGNPCDSIDQTYAFPATRGERAA